jgi:hypothetical protein
MEVNILTPLFLVTFDLKLRDHKGKKDDLDIKEFTFEIM